MVISLESAKDAMRRCASAAVTENLSKSLDEYKRLYDITNINSPVDIVEKLQINYLIQRAKKTTV